MPLYEYCCENCGEEFEKLVRFSEADLTQLRRQTHLQEDHRSRQLRLRIGRRRQSLLWRELRQRRGLFLSGLSKQLAVRWQTQGMEENETG